MQTKLNSSRVGRTCFTFSILPRTYRPVTIGFVLFVKRSTSLGTGSLHFRYVISTFEHFLPFGRDDLFCFARRPNGILWFDSDCLSITFENRLLKLNYAGT